MPDSESKVNILPQRLCSEIQLFDLCDADSCSNKNGRFCTDPELLGRFEKIAENEIRTPERLVSEKDDDEAFDGDDDAYEDAEFASEDFEEGNDDGLDEED